MDFLVDVVKVRLYRMQTDAQGIGNFLIAFSGSDMPEDFSFLGR
jgi:hypothetical protein